MDAQPYDGQPPAERYPADEPSFRQHVAAIAQVIDDVEEGATDHVRHLVFDLLEHVDALHRIALTRLLEILVSSGHHTVIETITRDPVVALLLELYSLPADEAEDAQRQLQAILSEHGYDPGAVEVVAVADGVVSLRFSDAAALLTTHERATLTSVLEKSLSERGSGVDRVAIVANGPPSQPVQSETLVPIIPAEIVRRIPAWRARPARPVTVPMDDALAPGHMCGVTLDGERVLLYRSSGDAGWRAYLDRCPGSVLPLSLGTLDGTTLHCPWHNCRYNIETGEALAASHPLERVEVREGSDSAIVVLLESATRRSSP